MANRRKFQIGDKAIVLPPKNKSGDRFSNWEGTQGIITGHRVIGQGNSEYRLYDPERKRSRWVWTELLIKCKEGKSLDSHIYDAMDEATVKELSRPWFKGEGPYEGDPVYNYEYGSRDLTTAYFKLGGKHFLKGTADKNYRDVIDAMAVSRLHRDIDTLAWNKVEKEFPEADPGTKIMLADFIKGQLLEDV